MDIERAKTDMVYYVENFLGLQLQEWQKEILRRHENGEVLYLGGLRSGKNLYKYWTSNHERFKCEIDTKIE